MGKISAARAVTSVVVLASLTLSGCIDLDPVDTSPSPTTTSPSPTTSSSSSGDVGIAAPPAPAEADVPVGVEPGSDAAIAWEALMSPVGEYAAAASYLAVLDEFGSVEPYATILQDELRHIDALTRQLDRAGIVVPENPYLGVVVAPVDLQAAAEAWALGEINNVTLYDKLLAEAADGRLVTVLGNLRRASLESHLPLFEAAAANAGTLDELPARTP